MSVFLTLGQVVNSDSWLRVLDVALSRVNTFKAMNFTAEESYNVVADQGCMECNYMQSYSYNGEGYTIPSPYGDMMMHTVNSCNDLEDVFTGWSWGGSTMTNVGNEAGSCAWDCELQARCVWPVVVLRNT